MRKRLSSAIYLSRIILANCGRQKSIPFAILLVLHATFWPVIPAMAAQNVTIPSLDAMGQNPNSNITLDPDGTPTGAQGFYTPAEKNPMLGKAAFLTPIECLKRYGEQFCACSTMQDGSTYCYYSRPSSGYYTSMEACENVWGAGHCVCSAPDKCSLFQPEDLGKELQCLGQVYFFSGEKMECRKSGIMTMGTDCCKKESETAEACSFENVAKKLGMDDLALASISLGTKLADLAGYSATDFIAKEIATVVVQEWLTEGSVAGIMSSLTSLLGEKGAEVAVDALADALANQAGQIVIENAVAQGAVTAVASAITSMVTIVGWIYFAFQVYNMITEMQKCTSGEFILGCKLAKGICHKVGNRCKVKVAGSCLQSMGVYCCFNTKLAKIINEQGREQIGKGWGSAKKPDCKGFMMDEFARLDLSKVDFSEYADDLIREMNPNIQQKLEDATKNLNQNFIQ